VQRYKRPSKSPIVLRDTLSYIESYMAGSKLVVYVCRNTAVPTDTTKVVKSRDSTTRTLRRACNEMQCTWSRFVPSIAFFLEASLSPLRRQQTALALRPNVHDLVLHVGRKRSIWSRDLYHAVQQTHTLLITQKGVMFQGKQTQSNQVHSFARIRYTNLALSRPLRTP